MSSGPWSLPRPKLIVILGRYDCSTDCFIKSTCHLILYKLYFLRRNLSQTFAFGRLIIILFFFSPRPFERIRHQCESYCQFEEKNSLDSRLVGVLPFWTSPKRNMCSACRVIENSLTLSMESWTLGKSTGGAERDATRAQRFLPPSGSVSFHFSLRAFLYTDR